MAYSGMRLNFKDGTDQRIYSDYLQFLWRARSNHFNEIIEHVNRDLGIHGFRDFAPYPIEDFNLHSGLNLHYRGMSFYEFRSTFLPKLWHEHHTRILREEFRLFLQRDLLISGQGLDDLQISDEEFDQWESGVFVAKDVEDWSRVVLFPVGGMPCNSGIYLKLNLDLLNSIFVNAEPNRKFVTSLIQPIKTTHALQLFLANQMAVDPFNCFFTDNYCIDSEALKQEKRILSASGMQLKEYLNHSVNHDSGRGNLQNMYLEELLRLYGKRDSPSLLFMTYMRENASLTTLAVGLHEMFRNAVIDAKDTMLAGELLQFEMAARCIDQLKNQSITCRSTLKAQHKLFLENYAAHFSKSSFLNDHNIVACYHSFIRDKLNLDIYWGNQMLIDELLNAMIGLFCYQGMGWGYTIWISNMGQSTAVLCESHMHNRSREPRVISMKDPSMGADAACQTVGLLNHAFCKIAYKDLQDQTLHRHYTNDQNKDEVRAWSSALALSTAWGCGIQMSGSSNLRDIDQSFRENMGLGGVFTEMMKKNSSSNYSADEIGNIETSLANSGQGEGMKQCNWSTTHQMTPITVASFQPLPLYLMCSNRNMQKVPRSLAEGGRVKIMCTTVEDGQCGVLEINNSKKRKTMDEPSGLFYCFDEGAQGMNALTTHKIENNLMFFIARQWMRFIVPFTHRVLACSVHDAIYCMTLNFRSLHNFCFHLTLQNSKAYFSKRRTFQRSFDGPFRTATAIPIFIQNAVVRSLLQSVNCKDEHEINLQKTLHNCFSTLYNVPIDNHTMLTATYSWLSQSVLDPNIMIITCFACYLLGLKEHCPVFVLAKVFKSPEKMTDLEWTQYERFARMISRWVLVPKTFPVLLSNNSHLRKDQFASRSQSRLAMNEHFVHYKRRSLMRLYSKERDNERCQKIFTEDYKNRHGNEFSTYLRPDIVFHDEKPHWCVRRQTSFVNPNNNDNGDQAQQEESGDEEDDAMDTDNAIIRDKYVMNGVITKIAHSFAQQQGDDAEVTRAKYKSKKQNHHHVADFWKSTHAGTKLPAPETTETQDSSYEFKFKAVEMTSFWWLQTMKNAGGCTGPIRQFLNFMGLSCEISRREFVIKLLEPFFDRNGFDSNMTVPDNDEWRKPILTFYNKTLVVNEPVFKFGAHPFRDPRTLKFGGLESFLGMDVIWFILGQAMYCTDWKAQYHESKKTEEGDPEIIKQSCVVHLRNMGGAAKTLLEIMLHTMVAKSEVPAGPIILNCPESNKINKQDDWTKSPPVQLSYLASLHSDSADNTCNNLSIWRRKSSEIVVNNSLAQFSSIANAKTPLVIPNGFIFTYPPENIAHVQGYFNQIYLATRRLHTDFPKNRSTVSLALRLILSSVKSEMLMCYGLHLTDCVASLSEIPCLTCQNGYIFVLRAERNGYKIMPVARTHVTTQTHKFLMEYDTFEPLPLGEKSNKYIPGFTLENFQTNGLFYNPSLGEVRRKKEHEDETLPFVFMPTIFQEHLVCLQLSNKFYFGREFVEDEVHKHIFQIFESEKLFTMTLRFHFDQHNTSAWVAWTNDHFDLNLQDFRNIGNIELIVIDHQQIWLDVVQNHDDEINPLDRLQMIENTAYWIKFESNYFFFNSKSELKLFLHLFSGRMETLWDTYDQNFTQNVFRKVDCLHDELFDNVDLKVERFYNVCHGKNLGLDKDFTGQPVIHVPLIDGAKTLTHFEDILELQKNQAKRDELTCKKSTKTKRITQDGNTFEERQALRDAISILTNDILQMDQLIDNQKQSIMQTFLLSDAIFDCYFETDMPPTLVACAPVALLTDELKFYSPGLIVRHSNKSFLKNGDYKVKFYEHDQIDSFIDSNFQNGFCQMADLSFTTTARVYHGYQQTFDFVSIERAVVPEGSPLYLLVTAERMRQLNHVMNVHSCSVAFPISFDIDIMDEDGFSEFSFKEYDMFVLKVYYILGAENLKQNPDDFIRVLLVVSVFNHDTRKHEQKKVIFTCALHDVTAFPIFLFSEAHATAFIQESKIQCFSKVQEKLFAYFEENNNARDIENDALFQSDRYANGNGIADVYNDETYENNIGDESDDIEDSDEEDVMQVLQGGDFDEEDEEDEEDINDDDEDDEGSRSPTLNSYFDDAAEED